MKKLILLIATVFLISCGEKAVVEWPELTKLDTISIEIEAAAHDHSHEKEEQALIKAKDQIALIATSIPENAQNKDAVKHLISELESVAKEIGDLKNKGHEDIHNLSSSIHPIVALLMETAGVPHVHAAADSHEGHDHSGHDHGAHDHSEHNHGSHDHGGHDHGDHSDSHDHGDHSHGEEDHGHSHDHSDHSH